MANISTCITYKEIIFGCIKVVRVYITIQLYIHYRLTFTRYSPGRVHTQRLMHEKHTPQRIQT